MIRFLIRLRSAVVNITRGTFDAAQLLGVLFFFLFTLPGVWDIACWNPYGIVLIILGLTTSNYFLTNTK